MEPAAALSPSPSSTARNSSITKSPFSLSRTPLHHRPPTGSTQLIIVANANCGSGPKGSGGGRHRGRRASPVDEFMPLLRARIREVEAAEKLARGSEGATALGMLPAETGEWAEWERRYYLTGGYHRDVFGAVGALQTLLMGLRPGAVVGAVALFLIGLVMTGIAVSKSIALALIAQVTA